MTLRSRRASFCPSATGCSLYELWMNECILLFSIWQCYSNSVLDYNIHERTKLYMRTEHTRNVALQQCSELCSRPTVIWLMSYSRPPWCSGEVALSKHVWQMVYLFYSTQQCYIHNVYENSTFRRTNWHNLLLYQQSTRVKVICQMSIHCQADTQASHIINCTCLTFQRSFLLQHIT